MHDQQWRAYKKKTKQTKTKMLNFQLDIDF